MSAGAAGVDERAWCVGNTGDDDDVDDDDDY
jgi:hypothetical protein